MRGALTAQRPAFVCRRQVIEHAVLIPRRRDTADAQRARRPFPRRGLERVFFREPHVDALWARHSQSTSWRCSCAGRGARGAGCAGSSEASCASSPPSKSHRPYAQPSYIARKLERQSAHAKVRDEPAIAAADARGEMPAAGAENVSACSNVHKPHVKPSLLARAHDAVHVHAGSGGLPSAAGSRTPSRRRWAHDELFKPLNERPSRVAVTTRASRRWITSRLNCGPGAATLRSTSQSRSAAYSSGLSSSRPANTPCRSTKRTEAIASDALAAGAGAARCARCAIRDVSSAAAATACPSGLVCCSIQRFASKPRPILTTWPNGCCESGKSAMWNALSVGYERMRWRARRLMRRS